MATVELKGGKRLAAELRRIAARLERAAAVNVGFLENAKYPATVHRPKQEGMPVAQVAFWDEYGTVTSPPRPFFRQMIEQNRAEWPKMLTAALKQHGYDTQAALTVLGIEIAAELQESIRSGDFEPLSPVSLMLRKMADDDPSLVVTRKTVGEARRRVAAGEQGAVGDRARVLQDTRVMIQAVDYEVKKP